MAARLSERAEGTITVDDVKNSPTIEALATIVREHLEAGELDGFVRTLRAPKEGSNSVPVFVFHPAGGSTVVYEPLLKRLPADTPMYGFERVEGSIEERAAEYVPKLLEMHDGPFILAGWSLGGVLAYACAIGLKQAGADVRFVGLIDTVRAGEEVPQTKEEIRAALGSLRAVRRAHVQRADPRDPVRAARGARRRGPGAVRAGRRQGRAACRFPAASSSTSARRIWTTARSTPRRSSRTTGTSRSTWPTATTTTRSSSSRGTPPASRTAAGASSSSDLEVVPIGGEHIQAIDEPYIAKVGAHMSEAINRIEAGSDQEKQAK